MKCCWMLLVCVGIAACTTEALETSAETQAVYQGKRVPAPKVYLYKGGSLPDATDSQVWVIAKSPLYLEEDLAVLVDTADGGKLISALRVPLANSSEFNFVLGKTGAGYLRPQPGTAPPPPPDVWPTWYMAAAFRVMDLPKLATFDAYAAPY